MPRKLRLTLGKKLYKSRLIPTQPEKNVKESSIDSSLFSLSPAISRRFRGRRYRWTPRKKTENNKNETPIDSSLFSVPSVIFKRKFRIKRTTHFTRRKKGRKQRKPQPATSNAADVQPFDGQSTSRYPSLPITPTPISPTISTPPIKKRQRNSQVIPYSDRLTRLQSRLSKSSIAKSSPALPRPRPQPPPRVTRLQLRLSNSSIAYSSPALPPPPPPPPPITVTDVKTDEVFEDLKIEIKGHFLQNEVNFNEADDQLNVTQNGLFSIKQENCDEEHTESLQQIFNQDKNDSDMKCHLVQQNFNTQPIKVMDVKNELDNVFEDIKIEVIEHPLKILKKEDNFNEEYAQLDVMQNEIFLIKQEHMNDADIKWCN